MGGYWRGKLQPTPVFLPAKFHEHRSLESYSPGCHQEFNVTEHTHNKGMAIIFTSQSLK